MRTWVYARPQVMSLCFQRGALAGLISAGSSRWKFLGAAMLPVVLVISKSE